VGMAGERVIDMCSVGRAGERVIDMCSASRAGERVIGMCSVGRAGEQVIVQNPSTMRLYHSVVWNSSAWFTIESNLNKLTSIISMPYFGKRSNETRGNQDCLRIYMKQVKSLFCQALLMHLGQKIFLQGDILKGNVCVN